MSVTYLVATLGRPTLPRALQSITSQRMAGDQLLVIGATPDIQRTAEQHGGEFVYCPPGHDWGSSERNFAMGSARGDYLAFLDDDDVAAPGARASMEASITAHPGLPLVFRMLLPDMGLVLWIEPQRRLGNVGTPMLVIPNEPEKLGTWGSAHGGDFDFLMSCQWQASDLVWIPNIVAHVWPHEWRG
jgi:glycosyl transferase family 2